MSRLRVGVALATLATATFAMTALTAAPAFAHEVRKVGAYEFTVGWAHEPTYTGVENAVQLILKDAKGNPVDDLADPPSLKAQVINGDQTSDPLDLKASFDPDTGLGTHGEFDAAIVPTVPGDYTFHFTGNVNGQNVDEKFTSSDKTFDPVKDPTEVQFPAKTPSNGQLATSVDRINSRVASAKDSADSAKTMAYIGIGLAVVLGGAGLIVALSARRRPA
jgi:hypothetical protein